MTPLRSITFKALDLGSISTEAGKVAVFIGEGGSMGPCARRVNRLTKGVLKRFVENAEFAEMKAGAVREIAYPAGMQAQSLLVVVLERRADARTARAAGAALAKMAGTAPLLVLAGSLARAAELSFGLGLRSYAFCDHKTIEPRKDFGLAEIMVTNPEVVAAQALPMAALVDGVFFTRDLVNEPANILTTNDFAARLAAMQELGLDVEILEEADLEALGMGALLSVGRGSESPTKLVVMQWNGGTSGAAPLALVGKGVVFDTGGISLKPALGMEDMTMDMGGAGVVSGVMRTLALRKARANVVGVVGIVENMPDGHATRPGDIVTSMKGDTIEVVNTDAEGRLVLADALWYAQDRFTPSAVIDLATLTGAVIIGLGHENAGVFSNDDALCAAFLKAAEAEGEGAWRLPLGAAYDKLIDCDKADMKNTGGRPAGSITAAQFLQRFVKPDMPWIHLDIAGVAQLTSKTAFAPKGATGWGVITLDRLIRDRLER